MKRILTVAVALLLCLACRDRANELNNGVMYAKNALQQVGANPFSRATYEGIMRNGGNPADYIKATLPKEKPPFESFEFKKATHPWTVVIRPSTTGNTYFVEGYGEDIKQPIIVKEVEVDLPSSE